MAVVYRRFSEDTWESWENAGITEVREAIQGCLADKDPTLTKENASKDLNVILYEITWAVVQGHLKKEQAKPVLVDAMSLHPDVCSQLVEILAMMELEITTHEPFVKMRDNLIKFMQILSLERMYRERLELETLSDIGIVKNKKLFHTKQIKVRTKMFYKQQKFNLLREECEGYAKLVTELNQSLDSSVTPQTMIQVIRSLIGCFNLDPNRVLDLILEALECRPVEHHFYTSLLKLFPCQSTTLTELLGFRMNACSSAAQQRPVYNCMALLVQAGVLTLAEVYAWLTPDDSVMHEEHQALEDAAQEFARKANVISTKDKDKDKEKKEERDEEQKEKELLDDGRYTNNQKVQFVVALLEVGDWAHFQEVSSRFPEYYLSSCLPVGNALAQLCHVVLEPCYRSLYSLPARAGGCPVPSLQNPYAVPRCNTAAELASSLVPMVCALGPHIARHPSLMVKLLRIARVVLSKVDTLASERDIFYYEFLSVLDEALLPGLSVLLCNPCMAEEVWETLKLYPYEYRFKLYGKWKNETMNQHPVLVRTRTNLLKKAKYVMMRVTKDTIKPISRSIAKLTHNCPPTILDYVVKQIQLYDNLIVPVVDSLKYLTSLSFDVLGFCIVETLTTNKERLINAGMAVSPWLTSLSNFCGAVYKKYPIELCGVLQFVANQLKAERSVDLLLLQEILQKMGGTDTTEDLTPEQIEAMSGGEILRREAGTYLQERNTKRSSQRLKEVLLQNNLAVPLLLLIAQQRSCIVYNQTEAPHLKLVGKLYDQCQETLAQFGAYLFQVISLEELNERLPSIGGLLSDCHVNSDVAFFLARPTVTAQVSARFDEMRRSNRNEDKKQLYIDACTEVLSPLVEEIRPHFPAKLWEEMHPSFFLTFWTLCLADLEVPKNSYKREVARLSEMMIQLQKSSKDEPQAMQSKRKKELERVTTLRDKLLEEETRQCEHVERVMARLIEEKERWFTQRVACLPKNDTVTAFLQLCLFPRCTFTTVDALYCARFVKMMHELKTPNFSTLIFCDRMFCDITYTVASCTEQEAHRYAQFLQGTLDMVMHWHASSDNYEQECAKFPGFVTRFRVSKMESNDYVDYENYRHVVHKWHFKITKALVTCLESGDYIQIRNAILVLQGILSCFPAIVNLANVIDKRIEKVKRDEKNNRNDLYVLANSYSGRLRAKKSKLLQEKDFHQVRKPEEKKPPPPPPQQQQQQQQPVTNGVDAKAKAADGKVSSEEKNDVSQDNKEAKKDTGSDANKDQVNNTTQKKDGKRNKAEAEEDDEVHEVGGDSDEATNDSSGDTLRKSKRQKTDNSSKTQTHKACNHKSNKQDKDTPSKRKSEHKRERSVDDVAAPNYKRKRSDQHNPGRNILQDDIHEVEVEKDETEKKRSTRRRN